MKFVINFVDFVYFFLNHKPFKKRRKNASSTNDNRNMNKITLLTICYSCLVFLMYFGRLQVVFALNFVAALSFLAFVCLFYNPLN